MQARHRAEFLLLLDRCLASGLLPAYTAAAFAKRFARLAVAAPPAGAIISIAFIHNLVRQAVSPGRIDGGMLRVLPGPYAQPQILIIYLIFMAFEVGMEQRRVCHWWRCSVRVSQPRLHAKP